MLLPAEMAAQRVIDINSKQLTPTRQYDRVAMVAPKYPSVVTS